MMRGSASARADALADLGLGQVRSEAQAQHLAVPGADATHQTRQRGAVLGPLQALGQLRDGAIDAQGEFLGAAREVPAQGSREPV